MKARENHWRGSSLGSKVSAGLSSSCSGFLKTPDQTSVMHKPQFLNIFSLDSSVDNCVCHKAIDPGYSLLGKFLRLLPQQ